MTYSALARPYAMGRVQPRVASQPRALPAVNNLVLYIVLGCLLGLVYLVQVTSINAKGYQVDHLSEQATALQAQNDDLTLAGAQAQNLDRIQNYGNEVGMVAVTPQ